MTKKTVRTAVITMTAILLLCSPMSASAHKAHEKAATEASKTDSPSQMQAPKASTIPKVAPRPDAHPHDHSAHGTSSGAAPAADNEAAAAETRSSQSNVPKPLAWLGKFHPPATHFPIALLVAAAIAELLFMRTGKIQFDHAARFSVWLGAGAALATAPLGWLFAGFQLVDEEWVMTAHRWFGTGTALWAGGLLYVSTQLGQSESSRGRFRLILFVGAGLVSMTGFLGGSLLYGIDHYAW